MDLPYKMNDDGTVAIIRKFYQVKSGHMISFDVPVPKGPDDGWEEGQYEKYMRDLEQKAAPMIRSAIKQRFGTTKYRLVREEHTSLPVDIVTRNHQAMLERMN